MSAKICSECVTDHPPCTELPFTVKCVCGEDAVAHLDSRSVMYLRCLKCGQTRRSETTLHVHCCPECGWKQTYPEKTS